MYCKKVGESFSWISAAKRGRGFSFPLQEDGKGGGRSAPSISSNGLPPLLLLVLHTAASRHLRRHFSTMELFFFSLLPLFLFFRIEKKRKVLFFSRHLAFVAKPHDCWRGRSRRRSIKLSKMEVAAGTRSTPSDLLIDRAEGRTK